jgi:hypothetical protein
VLSLTALAVANPLLNTRAIIKEGEIILYTDPNCKSGDLPVPLVDTVRVKIGECKDVAQTKVPIPSSIYGYTIGDPDPGIICETRGYFQEKCDGKTAVTDNFKRGTCLITVAAPTLGQVQPLLKSVMVMCCKAAADGKSCANPT